MKYAAMVVALFAVYLVVMLGQNSCSSMVEQFIDQFEEQLVADRAEIQTLKQSSMGKGYAEALAMVNTAALLEVFIEPGTPVALTHKKLETVTSKEIGTRSYCAVRGSLTFAFTQIGRQAEERELPFSVRFAYSDDDELSTNGANVVNAAIQNPFVAYLIESASQHKNAPTAKTGDGARK